MNEDKVLELEGKKFIVHKAPATVAYEVALRYKKVMDSLTGDKASDDVVKDQQACLYRLLCYVDVDLGDGRKARLDNETIINQHIKDMQSLVTLQNAAVEHNFGFFVGGAASNS